MSGRQINVGGKRRSCLFRPHGNLRALSIYRRNSQPDVATYTSSCHTRAVPYDYDAAGITTQGIAWGMTRKRLRMSCPHINQLQDISENVARQELLNAAPVRRAQKITLPQYLPDTLYLGRYTCGWHGLRRWCRSQCSGNRRRNSYEGGLAHLSAASY